MADFLQPNQQQDPEALRKALLAKLFGGTPPPVAPGAAAASPTTPTVAPTSPAAQPLSTPPGPQPAKPLSAAPTPTVTDPGNQPPPILSETDWAKQNPQPAHTPYTPPDLKHRLLTGLFAGMQEFGRPGEGARTVANYGADIERKTEEEKNYPTTSAEATRKRYMDYVAGEKAPIDIEDLQAQIKERQAHARDLDAQAKARANPQDKLQHFVIKDPKDPTKPKAVSFNTKTGAYIDPDTGEAIPGAQAWEHQGTAAPQVKYDNGIPVAVTSGDKAFDIHDPNLPPELKPLVQSAVGAHKQALDEQTARELRAETRARGKEERTASRQEITAHDRAYVKPAEDAEKSYQMMNHAYQEYKTAEAAGKHLPTGAQSMVALSSHLQTTFGTVKGARVTKDMIEHHLGARGITDKAEVAINSLINGDALSADQWAAFHDLISHSRKLSWQTAVKEADRKKIPVDFLPKDLEGLSGDGEEKSGGGGGGNPQNPLDL